MVEMIRQSRVGSRNESYRTENTEEYLDLIAERDEELGQGEYRDSMQVSQSWDTKDEHVIKFDQRSMRFSEKYPIGLEAILHVAEFDAIVRRINYDMNRDARAARDRLVKCFCLHIPLLLLAVGILMTPLLLYTMHKQRRALKAFWEAIRKLFIELNAKTYIKRGLEWRLERDVRQLKTRDLVDPLVAYRIVLVHKNPEG